MNQYRLWIEYKLQLGLMIRYGKRDNSLLIQIPFLDIIIAFNKDAKGVYFFKHD